MGINNSIDSLQTLSPTSDVTFNSVTSTFIGDLTGNVTGDVTGYAYGVLTPYIVGAFNAPFATINDAINQAVLDGASISNIAVIRIQPGLYIENLTLYDGIVLLGNEPESWVDLLYQGVGNIPLSTKIAGNIVLDTSASTAATYTALINIWVSPATGDVITCIANNSVNPQYLVIQGCKLDVLADFGRAINQTATYINFIGSSANDLTPGSLGSFLYPNTTANAGVVTIADSMIYANFGSNALAVPSGAPFIVRMTNTTWYPTIDASLGGTFTFRMANSIMTALAHTNTVAMINLGSIVGTVVADNCIIITGASPNFVTSSSTGSQIICTNTSFGLAGFSGGTSDLVSGGRAVFTNCSTRDSSSNNYLRNDLITGAGANDFTGASEFVFQAGAQTTNATLTTLASILLNVTETITVIGTITGAQSDHSNAVGGNFTITARRAAAGNITLVGTEIVNVNSSSSATFTVSVNTGTQSVLIQITGVAATTYNWVTTYRYQKVLTNA